MIIRVLWWISVPTQKIKVDQGDIKNSKYHKNSSEMNVSERDLTPVKISSKNIEKQKS